MTNFLLRMKRFCGFAVGFVFFISGLLKLMDPVGAGLVMQEYFKFLHIGFMNFAAGTLGVTFALAEAFIGAGLVTGVWKKTMALTAVCIQGFFTFLTLILVIFNPQMDCGCFGEALSLSHWETFRKNIFLLAMMLAYYFPRKHLGEPKKKKYISFALVTVSVLAFTAYSLRYIPLIDFTDYKIGTELQARASIDTDEMYESVFTYEKGGVIEEFTLGHLPDSTWTFVSADTRLKEGHDETLAELSFYNPSTEEYMDTLATEGKVMVVSVYEAKTKARQWKKTETFIARAEAAGFKVLMLCTDTGNVPEGVLDNAYISDYKTLISMNRSNGGVTYFNDGVLIRKWARICAPDQAELDELQKTDTTEVSIARESKGSLVFQGFLLYVFAVMLLL